MTKLSRTVLSALTVLLLLLIPLLTIGGIWKFRQLGCASQTASTPARLLPSVHGVVRFAAMGDTGSGNARQMAVADAMANVCRAEGCDFLALLGDIVYPGGLESSEDPKFDSVVQAPYGRLDLPLVPVLGNHDVRGDVAAIRAESQRYGDWVMPEFSWNFRMGPAAFHAINSNCPLQDLPALAHNLPSADSARVRPWQFVLAHHPVYTVGHHGDAHPLTRWFWNHAIRARVDFYLSGHSHDLEHLRMPGEGTDFLVSGGGGQPRLEPVEDAPSAAGAWFRNRGSGFAWFEVRPAQVTFRFYDDRGAILYEGTRRR